MTVLNDDDSFVKLLEDSGMTVRVMVSSCTLRISGAYENVAFSHSRESTLGAFGIVCCK